MEEKLNKQDINLLCNEFKKIDLVEFISKETGVVFSKSKDRSCCVCPMPSHKDKKPSFFVSKMGDCWTYHCFGCNSGGTIIDFSMGFWSLETPLETVIFLAEKLGVTQTYEVVLKSIKEAKIECNIKKKIDGEHFIASKRCYRLLKRYGDDNDVREQIFELYRRMNKMLSENNFKGIENISYETLVLSKKQKEIV